MFQSHYKEGKAPAEESTIHRIRITLTSRNVKSLEKGTEIHQLAIKIVFDVYMIKYTIIKTAQFSLVVRVDALIVPILKHFMMQTCKIYPLELRTTETIFLYGGDILDHETNVA